VPNIRLPRDRSDSPGDLILHDVQSLVILGPNGSGKSKLGYWIEYNHGIDVHRIAAQRALTFRPDIQPLSSERARVQLLYGNADHAKAKTDVRKKFRWGETPTTKMITDYDLVLQYLFARKAKRDSDVVAMMQKGDPPDAVPPTDIDTLLEIWAQCMPARNLIMNDCSVTASTLNGTSYPATDMSDGERVTIYLIGQALAVKPGSLIIIDEPEVHLHKSILVPMWNALEAKRSDCTFIYITHDIHFARTRAAAHIVLVEDFHGGDRWTWRLLPRDQEVPSQTEVALIGNRQSVLFVEGTYDSLDYALYTILYPNHLVLPRGSCDKVKEGTYALREIPQFHQIDVFGIVDRDLRSDEQVARLGEKGVATVPVAEIENLFCIDEVLTIVAAHLELDPADTVSAVHDFVLRLFAKELDKQVALHAAADIAAQLQELPSSPRDCASLKASLDTLLQSVDVNSVTQSWRDRFAMIIEERDYNSCLRFLNRKSVCRRVARKFGMRDKEYTALVMRLLNGALRKPLSEALVNQLPSFLKPGAVTPTPVEATHEIKKATE